MVKQKGVRFPIALLRFIRINVMLEKDAHDDKVRMPLGLKVFFVYSGMFIAFVFAATGDCFGDWSRIRTVVSVTDCLPYLFGGSISAWLLLMAGGFPKAGLRRPNCRRLPWSMLAIMLLGMISGLVRFNLLKRSGSHYLSYSPWNLLISVGIPPLWVRIWFGEKVRCYLAKLSG
jgi:hypothetical protein